MENFKKPFKDGINLKRDKSAGQLDKESLNKIESKKNLDFINDDDKNNDEMKKGASNILVTFLKR